MGYLSNISERPVGDVTPNDCSKRKWLLHRVFNPQHMTSRILGKKFYRLIVLIYWAYGYTFAVGPEIRVMKLSKKQTVIIYYPRCLYNRWALVFLYWHTSRFVIWAPVKTVIARKSKDIHPITNICLQILIMTKPYLTLARRGVVVDILTQRLP